MLTHRPFFRCSPLGAHRSGSSLEVTGRFHLCTMWILRIDLFYRLYEVLNSCPRRCSWIILLIGIRFMSNWSVASFRSFFNLHIFQIDCNLFWWPVCSNCYYTEYSVLTSATNDAAQKKSSQVAQHVGHTFKSRLCWIEFSFNDPKLRGPEWVLELDYVNTDSVLPNGPLDFYDRNSVSMRIESMGSAHNCSL